MKVDVLEASVYLVRRSENDWRWIPQFAHRFKEIYCAARVNIEIVNGRTETARDRHLGSKMKYGGSLLDGSRQPACVACVSDFELNQIAVLLAEPLCIFFHSRAGKVVVKNHRLISRAQRVCQIAPDKSAAARDYNGAFPLSRTDVAPAQPGGVFDGFDSSLREQTKEKFFRVIVAAQSEMMLALVTVEFVLTRELRCIQVMSAVPVDAISGSAHHVEECRDLAAFIVPPS